MNTDLYSVDSVCSVDYLFSTSPWRTRMNTDFYSVDSVCSVDYLFSTEDTDEH